jgi:hypothetical protein
MDAALLTLAILVATTGTAIQIRRFLKDGTPMSKAAEIETSGILAGLDKK